NPNVSRLPAQFASVLSQTCAPEPPASLQSFPLDYFPLLVQNHEVAFLVRQIQSNRETLARISQCAVERRRFSVGAKPTRQLSLQPVAIGAGMEVTKLLKPLV